jgi:hypothetical protein
MSFGRSFDFLFNQMRNGVGNLASGTVEFYAAGTTNPKDVFLDRDMATTAANPYTLTADGTADLFGLGVYRVVIKDVDGVTVYDYDDVEAISVANQTSASATFNVVSALTDDALYTLTGDFDQYVSKVGETAYTVTISPPGGYTFAAGYSTYVLSSDNEVVHFLLSGTEFFVVS